MGKPGTVQKLSVAVGTDSQHSAEGLAAVLDAAKGLTVAVVGDGEAGRRLRDALARAGVDDGHVVTEPGRRTVVKRRLVAEGQLLARFDEGDRTPPNARALGDVARRTARLARSADAVVISDYGYGAVGDAVRA